MEQQNKSTNQTEAGKKLITKEALSWIKAIFIALLLAWVIRGFIFEHELVDGTSMNNTLQDRQHLLIYKLGYYFHSPERGDIITLQYDPGHFSKYLPIPDFAEVDYIKRIIGLPGETVDIRNGFVYINGYRLNEPYVKGITRPETIDFPLVVPDNEYLVMGDNREDSSDGREFGTISRNRIRGKAVFSVWPWKEIGGIDRNFNKEQYGSLRK